MMAAFLNDQFGFISVDQERAVVYISSWLGHGVTSALQLAERRDKRAMNRVDDRGKLTLTY